MTILSSSQSSIYIAQGEQAIGTRPEHVISTILGSCVSVCLSDSRLGIGGMNHILVPEGRGSDLSARGVGAFAMENLINALLKMGASKGSLTAKVFGGAAVVKGLSDIGKRNCVFVFDFLRLEGIPLIAESTGGLQARRIQFLPATGKVRQRLISAETVPEPRIVVPVSNDLELL